MNSVAKNGYTIVEVMIFLAITGLLFVSAATAIGGSQSQVQYAQSVRDFETQVKDVINDVADGYYPNYDRGRCNPNGAQITWNNAIFGEPGTSSGCINIGKTIMFNLDGNTDRFGVGTIVGANPSFGSTEDYSYTSLKPTIAYSNQIDMTTYKPVRFGARVTKIALVDVPATTFSSLSFISGFSASQDTISFQNGTLSTNVMGLVEGDSMKVNPDIDSYKDDVQSIKDPAVLNSDAVVNPPGGFYICLQNSDDRLARIFIGIEGVVTATSTEFDIEPGAICDVV